MAAAVYISLLISILIFVDARVVKHPKSDPIIKNLHPQPDTIINDNFKWSDYQQNTPWDATNFCTSLYVSPLITDKMILQRGSPGANIFGWGLPGSTVTLQFNGKNYQSKVNINDNSLNACSWSIQLPPMTFSQRSESYKISISSTAANSTTFTFNDIQFGDIWVCSGS